jgi:hypothetical protein
MTEFFDNPNPKTLAETKQEEYEHYLEAQTDKDSAHMDELRDAVNALTSELRQRNVRTDVTLISTPVRHPSNLWKRFMKESPTFEKPKEIGSGWVLSREWTTETGADERGTFGSNSSRTIVLTPESKLLVGWGIIEARKLKIFGEIRWNLLYHSPIEPPFLEIYAYPDTVEEVPPVYDKFYERADMEDLERDIRTSGRRLLGYE